MPGVTEEKPQSGWSAAGIEPLASEEALLYINENLEERKHCIKTCLHRRLFIGTVWAEAQV